MPTDGVGARVPGLRPGSLIAAAARRWHVPGMSTRRTYCLLLRARPFVVFVPWLTFVVTWIALSGRVSAGQSLLLVAGGIAVWSLLEWVVHWAMHVPVRTSAIARFQDRAHIRHHREPHDVEHSVMMLRGSIPLALATLGVSLVLFRDPTAALLFHSGLILGYLTYEFVHLAHHAGWHVPGTRRLMHHHGRHHYGGWRRAYGVTTPLWDWVFGTLPERSVDT